MLKQKDGILQLYESEFAEFQNSQNCLNQNLQNFRICKIV